MNNETKHTAGNWDVSTHADNNDIVVRSIKGIIANLSTDKCAEISQEEAEANARLIAAAPELLDALSNAQEQIEYLQSKLTPSKRDFTKPTTNVCMEQIRAAISKAIQG